MYVRPTAKNRHIIKEAMGIDWKIKKIIRIVPYIRSYICTYEFFLLNYIIIVRTCFFFKFFFFWLFSWCEV